MEAREVAFAGRITAGITHEMKNVLAIIRESTGLMEDLLSLQKDDSFPYKEKFLKTLATVQGQVRRGVELSSRLNRFAHSPDEPVVSVDLNEVIEQVVFLSQRFARLKGIVLEAVPGGVSVVVTTNLVQLQMLLFFCLECLWIRMESGGVIRLSCEKQERTGSIRLTCQGSSPEQENLPDILSQCPSWSEVSNLAGQLSVEIKKDASSSALALVFPEVSP